MNVYDFDKTIFYPDASISFTLWELKRHFFKVLPHVVKMIAMNGKYKKGKVTTNRIALELCKIFSIIKNPEQEVEKFWDKHMDHIASWYLAQKRDTDLIISASAECLIGPIAKRLGVNYIATKYDIEYRVIYGNTMIAKEKARYIINDNMPLIENFYSDFLSDTPAALLAERAWLVVEKGQKLIPWPDVHGEQNQAIKNKIKSCE